LVSQAGVENYGVAKWGMDTSYLKQIVANNGRVDICIDLKGNPGEDLYLNTVPNAAQKSIKEWTRVLYGYRDWPYREVAVNWVNPSSQQCPANKEIIRIHVLERGVLSDSKNIVKNTFCTQFQTAPICADIVRSYALPLNREIFLIPEGTNNIDRTILHELGHIFGLHDVYHEKGRYDYVPANPVASVMADNATSVAINGDDAQGLRWIWDAIQGRRDFENPSCGTGYKDSGTYKQAGILYCVPTNVPKSQTTNSQSFNPNPNSNTTKLVCNRTELTQCLMYKGGSKCITDKCRTEKSGTQPGVDDLQFTFGAQTLRDCVANGGGAACIMSAQRDESRG
jgi:hypothetical protein